MAVSESSRLLERIKAAVSELEAAEARAATRCAECGAAHTLAVETARRQVVVYARALYGSGGKS